MPTESRENVVSLLRWLIERARRRGEPTAPILRRLVLGTIEEVRAAIEPGQAVGGSAEGVEAQIPNRIRES